MSAAAISWFSAASAYRRLADGQLRLMLCCVLPVPAPPAGTTTPAVLEALVAWAGEATVRGVLGAYIASSKVVVLGCCKPTAKSVATLPPEKELEM
jgi:predicted benzoate:H+ symporter BenE